MKWLKGTLIIAALGAAMVGTGCSSVQKGAAAGGALGATVGAVLGNNGAPFSVAGGAFTGGAVGTATGGLAGDAYELMTQDDIERELENLRAELSDRESELAALRANGGSPDMARDLELSRQELASAIADLEAAKAQLAERDAAVAANNDRIADLESDLASALAGRTASEGELANLRKELQNAQNDLQDAQRELADARTARDKALSDLDRAKSELGLTIEERDRVKGDIDSMEQEAERLRQQAAEAERMLSEARKRADVMQATLAEREGAVDALRNQLADMNVKLEETSRGLTLTIVDELLFRPGKAELSTSGKKLIGDVAAILHSQFPNRELLIEGHTDNVPITKSGWRSNWELGAARALTVVHEMIDSQGFDPTRLSATTYGEHRPASPNATTEGRAQNRRSVIVILPEKMPLQRSTIASAS